MEAENPTNVNNPRSDVPTDLCLSNQTTKNKRKNFNPKFTSISEDIKPAYTDDRTSELISTGFDDKCLPKNEIHNNKEQLPSCLSLENNLNSNSVPHEPDPENKYRDFAFKTMQELLNIYGLALTFNDMVDAFKQQKLHLNGKITF